MKKNILVLASFFIVQLTIAQTNNIGKSFMSGDYKGKQFQLGSEMAKTVVLNNITAYNLNDGSDLFYASASITDNAPLIKWHNSMKYLNEVPKAIFSIKTKESNDELVFLYADEDRIYKNGSKQKLKVMELFSVNPSGKITSFDQFYQIPESNEFGKETGGKYIPEQINSKNKETTFEFSNRGEIEAMEKFAKAFNAMDSKACAELLADKVIIHDFDGNIINFTKEMLPAMFDEYSSLNWKLNAIVPLKLTNTDPISSAFVSSTEKRVFKNGTVWEKELNESFNFDLNGKIFEITQFSRAMDKK